MRGKAWAPGVAVLLAVALAGCTGGEDTGGPDAKRGASDTTTAAAPRPGRFDTLPQPCKAVDRATLDSLLPGLRALPADEREDGYAGTLAPTFDNERKVGCAWKAEAAEDGDRTDSLTLDLERVVSYDAAKSDDDRAREIFEKHRTAAHIPDPSPSGSASASGSPSGSASGSPSGSPSGSASPGDSTAPSGSPSPTSGKTGKSGQSASGSPSPSTSGDTGATPAELLPRTLSGLGNDAFLNDTLGTASAGGSPRTVTVVFRTSNVVVSVVYQQQPGGADEVPDSKEMQDKARKLADRIAGSFEE
ncbi:hypothetical protein RM574_21270 [Streptomyces sp. DSM 41982]|uniref:DUF3558 domain-containing protein n=1 Tax=Streptomyces evansiae TaxID=3075535 RepID=A0ABD5ECS7_9ACTN|nr:MULTISPECIES: hypothetical protein [unclassified Streptomyces]MDT0418020.1 hypothetical protein [Streptomyces sp. DSM 41982]SCD77355.1 hypothetical protein GA0115246_1058614 [Streptomyces sp. SolWspMP-sol7th]